MEGGHVERALPEEIVSEDVLLKFEDLSRTVRSQQDSIEDLNVKLQHAEQTIRMLTEKDKASDGKLLFLKTQNSKLAEEKTHVIAMLSESNMQRQELTKEIHRIREQKRVLVAEVQKRRGAQTDDSSVGLKDQLKGPAKDAWKELSMQGFEQQVAAAAPPALPASPGTELNVQRTRRGSSITDKVSSWFSTGKTDEDKVEDTPPIPEDQAVDKASRPSLAPAENTERALEPTYGPDPTFVKWLVDFYTEHNPPKVPSAASTAEKWIGREETCMNLLEYKYGLRTSPPPELPQPLQVRLRAQSEEEGAPPPEFEDEDFEVTEKTDFQTGEVEIKLPPVEDQEQQAQEQEQKDGLETPRD